MWLDQRDSEVLERPECLRLLALEAREGALGRIGVALVDDRQGEIEAPLVVPVNFAYSGGKVVVRIGPGLLADTAPGRLVAFEVDRVEREHGLAWSVLVRGLASPHAGDDGPAAGETGPTPLVAHPGTLLLTVRPDVVTGRRFALSPSGGGRAA